MEKKENKTDKYEDFKTLQLEIEKKFPRVKSTQLINKRLIIEFIAIGDPEIYLSNYSVLNSFLNDKLATKKDYIIDFLIKILHE
jgi:hypothetical protein